MLDASIIRIAAALALSASAAAASPSPGAGGSPPAEPRTATLLVPEPGVLFVRYGEPGAVRIAAGRAPGADAAAREDAGRFPLSKERIAEIFREEYARARRGRFLLAPIPPPGAPPGPQPATPPLHPPSAPSSIIALPPASPLPPAPASDHDPVPDAESAEIAIEPEEVREFVLREFRYGGLLRSNLVIFETDKDVLIPYSSLVLGAVGDVLREFPSMRIRVEGHADLRGGEAHNLDLSRRRADSVRRYLVDEKGIEPDRIETIGHGEGRPLVPGTNETALTLNRRVEFRVLNPEEVFPER